MVNSGLDYFLDKVFNGRCVRYDGGIRDGEEGRGDGGEGGKEALRGRRAMKRMV